MSGFRTHMLIGAVGGLALAKLLAHTQFIPLPTGPSGLAHLGAPYIPLGVTGVGIIVSSACLALWPDLDEPNSKPAQYLKTTVALITAPLAAVVSYGLALQGLISQRPEVAAIVGFVLGLGLLGPLFGSLMLRLIHIGAGGHRRMTHSAVLGALLAGVSYTLWRNGQPVWALIPAALVWGQLLHVSGDVVTVSGVPLLYPFSSRDVGLPRPFSQWGETLITVAAVIAGYWLLSTRV